MPKKKSKRKYVCQSRARCCLGVYSRVAKASASAPARTPEATTGAAAAPVKVSGTEGSEGEVVFVWGTAGVGAGFVGAGGAGAGTSIHEELAGAEGAGTEGAGTEGVVTTGGAGGGGAGAEGTSPQ